MFIFSKLPILKVIYFEQWKDTPLQNRKNLHNCEVLPPHTHTVTTRL